MSLLEMLPYYVMIVFRVQDAQTHTESQPSGTLTNEVRT